MKKQKNFAFVSRIAFAATIVLSIVFIHSCKRETPAATQQDNKIKPQVVDCGPGYHWDFTLRQCVPNCQNGYVYCPALGTCVPNGGCSTGGGTEIDKFQNSSDFISFKNSNPAIASKISYAAAKVTIEYNQLYGDDLKYVFLPVIEATGDTSAMIMGIPLIVDNATTYLIFYVNNQLLTKDSRGYYYGTVQADLYNTTASYTVQFSSSGELVSNAITTGPRWISNNSCTTCKWVWPSLTCINDAMDYFFETCHCKVLCAISNLYRASCTVGTFAGAAAFCATHNNRPHN